MMEAWGISPNPEKKEAVANFQRPDTLTKLMAFLGLAGFFRKFILGSRILSALSKKLLKKEAHVVKNVEREEIGPLLHQVDKTIRITIEVIQNAVDLFRVQCTYCCLLVVC